jgi:threonine/homoserine/homoserine lactone efflux protein
MSLDHWIGFVAASAILLAIPGPTILLVVSYALGLGRRSAGAVVAGVALGDFTSMTLSMLGLGVVLAASATLFTLLKWAGAAYLVWLGIRLWRAPVAEAAAGPAGAASPRRMLAHAFAVTALNPKSIVFFVAFVPQFLDLSRPPAPQMAIFVATFVTMGALNAFLYALAASAARGAIATPAIQRAVNRAGGAVLIGAGVLSVAWRRAAA